MPDEPEMPDWYGPEVEAMLAVFRATDSPEDPSWRSIARRCVAAVDASRKEKADA